MQVLAPMNAYPYYVALRKDDTWTLVLELGKTFWSTPCTTRAL
jgi:hypothetical protein